MEKRIYITEEEHAKCQKVADAFAELYEVEDIVALDSGRYGFVELKYYKPPHGFEEDVIFTDSRSGVIQNYICLQKALFCWKRVIRVYLKALQTKNRRKLTRKNGFRCKTGQG